MKTVPLIRCILLGLTFVVFGLNGLWQTKSTEETSHVL